MEELVVDNFSEINIGLNIFEKEKNDGGNSNTTDNSNTDNQSADNNIIHNIDYLDNYEEKKQKTANC